MFVDFVFIFVLINIVPTIFTCGKCGHCVEPKAKAKNKNKNKGKEMTAQFIHVDTYSLVESKKTRVKKVKGTDGNLVNVEQKKTKGTISSIIAEGMREPDFCSHIKDPQDEIIYLYQNEETLGRQFRLSDIESYCEKVREENKDELGRKLRADASLLLAGVASFKREEDQTMEDCIQSDRFQVWMHETLEFIKNEYAENLKVVKLDFDEGHPHLHFYAVNDKGSAKKLHDGFRATDEFKKKHKQEYKSTDKEQLKSLKLRENQVYKKAMSSYQDKYQAHMKKVKYLKYGPRRTRDTRDEWLTKSANQKTAFNNEMQANTILAEANEKKAEANSLVQRAKAYKAKYKNLFNQIKDKAIYHIALYFAKQEAKKAFEAQEKESKAERARLEKENHKLTLELQKLQVEKTDAYESMKEKLEAKEEKNKKLSEELETAKLKLLPNIDNGSSKEIKPK
ncbi:hypothetical protein ACI48D_04845 [Massilia sp. LXY-6]|uniref:hypothetical protein n=1 Tax=Massilia sp. LXY-6 TaxID=3379823 RepID=UPI003EE37251